MVTVSFVDELVKIADAAIGMKPLSGTKPSTPSFSSSSVSGKVTLKPQTKGTDYTAVHSQPSGAASGTADGSKSVPPPPVVA